MTRLRRPHPRAFTLIDLMITMTIMVVMASVLVPMMRDDSTLRTIAAARLLAADLEVAQSMTITRPGAPIIVSFDDVNDAYQLALASDPGTPIQRPTGGAYRVEFGEGLARMARHVKIQLIDVTDDKIQFNGQGGLDDFTLIPKVKLYVSSNNAHGLVVSVVPTTGRIVEETY